MSPSTLPEVPAKHSDFISYINSNPKTSLPELLEPFKQYDAKLREVFAQEPDHPALKDQYLNITPVFVDGQEKDVKIHARDLEAETVEEKERYVMTLGDGERRPNGEPAIVQDLGDFQKNFALFCESSLVDLDWSNVVAAGSSVVTCMLPVPTKYSKSKKALRQYYHENIAPASDVDLFIYGLNEEEATKKIIQIEQRIKDSILTETTTIRTKNAITIASQYPTRHVQIVLRVYKSVSEILTGFDVDCSCAAYDGKQVWAAPRALTAYMTQSNTIDLTRRSPSYENRLSKYSRRGFEVYWPMLDRSRIDPTIFERNFARTVGLARLLVLERLPTKSEREAYMDERRRERGRPAINRYHNFSMQGNIKDRYEDEVAEWVNEDEVSDYHTFTIPYGPKYHAKKIEKLLYTKDLLLNAEWNKPKDREVNLHRHPAFFGYAEDVIHDCCGFCPKPVTPEEHDAAEEESKIYVSGEISFIKDDPGRQAIGSFNPITDDDWTEMAYVGNTERLCQAIIDEDLEHVQDWLAQEGADPNTRDYTGRTPLHLAVMVSSSEIVQALIDRDARLVARLADGRTALHLAAARGNVEIVKAIMQRSEANEEEETKKEDIRKQARIAAREQQDTMDVDEKDTKNHDNEEDNDIEMVEEEDSDEDMRSTTTGSYVKVKDDDKKKDDDVVPEEDEDEPDFYDINVLAWDTQCSPLHLAIVHGHIDVVKELVQSFGADVLLPIKLLNSYDKSPRGAILTLVLALRLPMEKAKAMAQTLLEIGASSAQADTRQTTAFHYISTQEPELLHTLFDFDEPAAKRAINHLCVGGSSWSPSAQSPLMSAIMGGDSLAALKLLGSGANAQIDFKDWMKSVEMQYDDVSRRDHTRNHTDFLKDVEQPIVIAVQAELPDLVKELLNRGADPNTLPKQTQQGLVQTYYSRYNKMESLLEMVWNKIKELRKFGDPHPPVMSDLLLQDGHDYLEGIQPGSYKEYVANVQLAGARKNDERTRDSYEKQMNTFNNRKGDAEKKAAVQALAAKYEELEKDLLARGAKPFAELYPDKVEEKHQNNNNYPWSSEPSKPKPFEIQFEFAVHDLTDETRAAYLQLFQAAWEGDLDTIKSLTLAPWGPSNENTPLKIAVQDRQDQSPFSTAVLRGHLDVARAIIEISFAQYHPGEEKPKARYRIAEEDDEDDDGDASMSDNVPVYAEIIDDKFTIENIGEVSTQVKSKTSPLNFMSFNHSCWNYLKLTNQPKPKYGSDDREVKGSGTNRLFSWAITTNGMKLFTFMLDLELEWTDRLANEEDGSSGIPSISNSDFLDAIKYGRIQMLAEMIKHSGAGMELESLVKKSGVKYVEKPKYYQGLSVHGKKRSDWINAARGTYQQNVTDTSPPLLQAAFKGSIASVEWWLSGTPARHYTDFAEAYKNDKLIAHLSSPAVGGFDKVLMKWLGARKELALHCAILAKPRVETTKLIEYLLKVMPESLDVKCNSGLTPLALAFTLRRLSAARRLIDAGADQSVRDRDGANILHLLLCTAYTNNAWNSTGLQDHLDLIDKRLVSSLFTERSSHQPGSLTPVLRWMRHTGSENDTVLRILLDFEKANGGNHEWLELLDASGDTPLHYAVKSQKQTWLKTMLEYRPDLLYRENSVGRTPYELAEDAYVSSCVGSAPNITYSRSFSSITNRSPESFIEGNEMTTEYVSKESIYRLCSKHMAEHPGKRRLVSLLDANEVAKRLAKRQQERAAGWRRDRDGGEESEDDEDEGEVASGSDEVGQWYRSAVPSYPRDT
ncbi:hypothetical protein BDV96DRAFT_502176 [Lophiotrema nucula]|uniref:Ankyrin repeat protein n=1 Tax=Lophiotrema nucula TaxID=690887 RepID=A0A6A5YRI7_9PLEO|nr:hypothetical protein BDV96DRAFT_502176 [Lophiotrema nucula]